MARVGPPPCTRASGRSDKPSVTAGSAEMRRAQLTRRCAHRYPNSATSLSNECWWKPLTKLAPREDHKLALVYETEKQKGNANRATLGVARKMVAYLLAVDRGRRNFVPAEEHTFCQGESNSSLRRRPGSIGTCQCQSLVVNLTALLIVSTEGELSVSVFSRTCRYTRTSCACRTGSVL